MSGIQIFKLQADRSGSKSTFTEVRSTWHGQGSWIGCKVSIEGGIVKKASLAIARFRSLDLFLESVKDH